MRRIAFVATEQKRPVMKFGHKIARIVFPAISLIVPVGGAAAFEQNGVKHALAVSIAADPKMTLGSSARGTLTARMRISAHSRSADFAGEVPVTFEDIDLNTQTPFREVWSEERCHDRRGLPRIWLLSLAGSITSGETKTVVRAETRHLGMLLPEDELRTEQQVVASNDTVSSERIQQARSLKSHLLIRLKLTSTTCVFESK